MWIEVDRVGTDIEGWTLNVLVWVCWDEKAKLLLLAWVGCDDGSKLLLAKAVEELSKPELWN